ncbi:AraC family transcriptional regulator [Paenibacillus sp. DR312]|uniref:AraC family transcriptional regulator n=2 Tax=unclassified Paenibacillus TaxID=185978 RepID=UPI000CFA924E|nr:AraC family transcriptional regulator [Paenibacillus sp. DR312]PRA02095.1 AraC family transcriptional regulator [Paenibacillus sp. MYb63]PRA44972.1 AraC family transcriptional regulator [Paenibacillus sp. MYb67]QZN75984.1 AraC family transcriptional regulator [Paenibacillus sp. DR312]
MEPTRSDRIFGRFKCLSDLKAGRHKGRFYRNSLMLILLIASIPGLITGIVMYQQVVGRMETEFNQMHQNQIENRARNVDDQLAYLEMNLSHWAFEPRFGNALRTLDFVYYFNETQEIVTTLYVLQGSHPLIKSAQLYLQEPKPILFNRDYTELNDEAKVQAYDRYLSMGNHVYWTDWVSSLNRDTEPSTNDSLLHMDAGNALVLVHKIPGESMNPFGALIITLDNEKVASLLKTLTPYDEGLTFLMDQEGNTLVTGNPGTAGETSAFEQQLKKEVALHADSRSFLFRYEDQTYSVSYGSLSRIDSDWTYVSAAPLTSVTSPVKLVSKIIVIASAGSLILGLLLSWFASRRIYSPVARMLHLLTPGRNETTPTDEKLDEFELLEQQWNELTSRSVTAHRQLQEQLPHLRDSFVLQLVQGHLYAYNEQDLQQRMRHLGFELEGQQYLLVQMYFTGYEQLQGRFGSQDTGLVTFAAVNITQEVAKNYFRQISVMNFHDLSSAMLVIAPQDEPVKSQAMLWGQELVEVIGRTLKMKVTLMVSRPAASLQELPGRFVEMEQAVAYRSVEEGSQILDLEDEACFRRNEAASYPLGLERELLQAIRLGKQDEAERVLEQFMSEITRTGSTEFQVQQMMLQLLGSIQHMMLQTGVTPYKLFGGCNMYERLSGIREPVQMRQWMINEVFIPYIQEVEVRSQEPLKLVVERTMLYIDTHYRSDISLENCADAEQMTPYALSKAFKQVSGINFIDYLTRVRMEAAKQLLRETTMKINDVAAAVGYQHSYFNRIFKKQEGVTPSQYRDQWFGQ